MRAGRPLFGGVGAPRGTAWRVLRGRHTGAECAVAPNDLDRCGPDPPVALDDHFGLFNEADEWAVGLRGGDEELAKSWADESDGELEGEGLADEVDAGRCALRLVEDEGAADVGELLLELQDGGRLVGWCRREEEVRAEVKSLLGVRTHGREVGGGWGWKMGEPLRCWQCTERFGRPVGAGFSPPACRPFGPGAAVSDRDAPESRGDPTVSRRSTGCAGSQWCWYCARISRSILLFRRGRSIARCTG